MNVSRVYLDTSILVKRYVKEENSDKADTHFQLAHSGLAVICLRLILVEAAVVFDKHSRKAGIDAKNPFKAMVSELKDLERSSSVEIYPVNSYLIRKAIKTVLEHHVYLVDAIQIETCIEAHGNAFFSEDMKLSETAKKIGLETVTII
jgi:predicted nucleic acid-binding protein